MKHNSEHNMARALACLWIVVCCLAALPAQAACLWDMDCGTFWGWLLLALLPPGLVALWWFALMGLRMRRIRFLGMGMDARGDGMAVLNRKHVYCAVNEAYAALLGLAPEDIAGRSVRDLWGDEAYAQRILPNLEAAFAGKTVRGRLVVSIPALQGRNVEVTYQPVFQHGRATHVSLFLHDVTRRVQAEAALRDRTTLYETLVESTNSIILRVTPQGRITFMNNYGLRFFGYTMEEVRDRHVLGLIVPPVDSDGRDLRTMWESIMADVDRHALNQNENLRRNGERAWILWSNRALRDNNGQITEVLSVGHDVTPLRQSRQELEGLRMALDQAGYGMAVADLDGRVRYLNPAWTSMHGLDPRGGVVGRNIGEFLAPLNDLDRLEAVFTTVRERGVYQEEMQHTARDGTTFTALTSITLLRSPSREPDGLVLMTVDVSERRKLLAELERSRQRLKVIVDNVHDVVFSMDADGRFQFVSSAVRELFGYEPKEVEGRKLEFLAHPEDALLCREALTEYAQGRSAPNSLELRGRNREGQIIWLVVNVSGIMARNGIPEQLVGVMRDTTEYRRMTMELHESRERFRELVQAIEEAYWLQDEHGIVYTSPGFEPIFGLTGTALQNTPAQLLEHVQPEDRELVRQMLPGGKLADTQQDVTLRVLLEEDAVRWVRVRTFPVVRNGKVLRVAGVAQDVTAYTLAVQQQREAKEAAEQASRVKSDFLARMGHEFRTPLNGVLGMLQLIAMPGVDKETRMSRVREAEHSARSLRDLLERLLEFVSLESCSRAEVEEYPFSLRDMLRGIQSRHEQSAREKGLDFAVLVDEKQRDFRGDGAKLRRVLEQLVDNAVKFTPKGRVKVHVRQEQTGKNRLRTCFYVDDEGPGIPEEMREVVFEPFMQGDGTYTRRYGGTGLGLGIVRQLVKCLGATIALEESPWGGTRVVMCLEGDSV
ncbi:PAS domain S-box-containing protein [Paucidesulfovibrio gracilis DSM 16080]|uniref:histidine kinase n=1 Tax=Paucidesulfovibrio gracilis DSM 16080 TaxID=1121449 RepID=A0A1T4XSU4_9BACT|nr:PAS domain S-box protein [Paucidesulfovibrio gracilis]SKA92594.1 PAS domain S-box-containing protein [Paucidesulfovibrio gracilis DSM 16080]